MAEVRVEQGHADNAGGLQCVMCYRSISNPNEAFGMAVYMGAGPAVMYATHALDAFMQFENENTFAQAWAFQSYG